MRRILFIIGTLDSGGVAKSIVNLLNVIDRKKQEVHLMVMSAGDGPFAQYIPEDVVIHRNPITAWLLSGFGGVWQLLKHGHLLLALGSLLRMALSMIDKPSAGWILAHLFPEMTEEWDVVVDFNGQQQLYYMVDKLLSKRKVTFFHNDYYKWRYYERMDRRYFKKVDNVYSISEQCVKSLKEIFPEVEDKIGLVYNVSLPDMIYKMAEEPVPIPQHSGALLVTVGHVCERKGIDLAIDAARILDEKGVDFLWLWLGTNNDSKYEIQIKGLGLDRKLKLCGICSNPYPYMKQADIIVHPSRYEGKSMTLDEAKILCKPIVVTNYSTVRDQFINGVNASICEMGGKALSCSIEYLLTNPERISRYSLNLRKSIPEYNSNLSKVNLILENDN